MIWTHAAAEPILRLNPGECNKFDHVVGCYDAEGQNTLRAILLRAKDCELELSSARTSLIELAESEPWYENQWLWLSVGFVIGAGGVVAISATH